MLISPLGLPNTGLSGSRSTDASFGSADAARGMASVAALAPSRASVSRRLKSFNLRILVPPSQRRFVTGQNIYRHRDNDSGEHDIERAAPLRQMARRARARQSPGDAPGDKQRGQSPGDQAR